MASKETAPLYCSPVAPQEFVPITFPSLSTKGPPLFPCEIGAVIAEAEDVTPTTIHNRLQLARAGKYLDTPGKGARR